MQALDTAQHFEGLAAEYKLTFRLAVGHRPEDLVFDSFDKAQKLCLFKFGIVVMLDIEQYCERCSDEYLLDGLDGNHHLVFGQGVEQDYYVRSSFGN